MAGEKEIRTKIKTIQSTQKITRAMEMVAASKMRRAQDRMQASRPYARRVKDIIKHVRNGNLEYPHPFLVQREIKTVGYVVVSTDRGLCGGLNVNLFKKIINELEDWDKKGIKHELCVFGKKAEAFFSRNGCNVIASKSDLGDYPTVKQLIGVTQVILQHYLQGKVDLVCLCYNKFINTMTQKAKIYQLIPSIEKQPEQQQNTWDYIYEPSAIELLDKLLDRYIESLIYQSVVENIACEQAARMVAMQSASDNAGELIKEFKLAYNKARQASITQELSEIVSGAAAV